jgi:hypothetical protein
VRLAARMAMHAAAWQSAPSPAWHPGARAGAWEHGAMDAPGRAEGEGRAADDAAAVAVQIPAARSEDGRCAREDWGGEMPTSATREVEARPSPDASPSSGWERGALEVRARSTIDASQVRGSAWSHGAYRLFVRGRAVRAATPEIMPCFEPVRARGVEAVPVSGAASRFEAAPGGVGRARVLAPMAGPVEARGGEHVRVVLSSGGRGARRAGAPPLSVTVAGAWRRLRWRRHGETGRIGRGAWSRAELGGRRGGGRGSCVAWSSGR